MLLEYSIIPFATLQPGNQAEWIQVILTTVGMVFIIWTLRSQLNVTKIEQRRFFRESMPYLSVSMTRETEDMDSFLATYKVRITAKRNDVYSLLVYPVVNLTEAIKIKPYGVIQGILIDDYIEIDYQINMLSRQVFIQSNETNKLNSILLITFKDIFDNGYQQVCNVSHNGTVTTSMPGSLSKRLITKSQKGFT